MPAFQSFFFTVLILMSVGANAQKPVLGIPTGHTNTISSLDFSLDGKILLSSSHDESLRIWDVESGKLLKSSPKTGQMILGGAQLSPNGRFASFTWSMTEAMPRIWDIFNNKVYNTGGIYPRGFSADGSWALAEMNDYDENDNPIYYMARWEVKERTFDESYAYKGIPFPMQVSGITSDGKRLYRIEKDLITYMAEEDGQILSKIKVEGLTDRGKLMGSDNILVEEVFEDPDSYQVSGIKMWIIANDKATEVMEFETNLSILSVTADGKYLLRGSDNGIVELVKVKTQKILKSWNSNREGDYGYAIPVIPATAFSPDGQLMAIGFSNGTIDIIEVATLEVQSTLQGHICTISNVEADRENKGFITVGEKGESRHWNFLSGQIDQVEPPRNHSLPGNSSTPAWYEHPIVYQQKAGLLSLETKEGANGKRTSVPVIKMLDGQTQPPTFEPLPFEYNGSMEDGFVDEKAQELWFWETFELTSGATNIYRYDILSGKLIRVYEEPKEEWTISAASDPKHRFLVTGTWDFNVNLFDLETGRVEHTFKGHSAGVNNLTFSPDGRLIISSATNGEIIIWSVDERKQIASLYEVDEEDWIVLKPDGLFDASPKAMSHMFYTLYDQGQYEIIELDQLKARFYDPGLLSKLLGFTQEPLRKVEGLNDIPLSPLVEARIQTDELKAKLNERSGGIGPVSVFVNGKEVTNQANPGNTTSFSLDLKPFHNLLDRSQGAINTVRVVAYNREGWLKSPPFTLQYEPEVWARGSGASEGRNDEAIDPTLFVVTIGTSNYAGDKMDLKFADQDAAVMAMATKAVGQGLFDKPGKLEVVCLNTSSSFQDTLRQNGISWTFADKANIEKILTDLQRKARAEDVLVVYFSGHGVTYGNADQSQFYYLTQGVASEDLSDKAIRDVYAISTEELTNWLNKIPALKQVLIIDACNSGKVVDQLTGGSKNVNSSQIRALDRMKDRTGVFILSGSASDKVSYEASAFGQGLLTYALLQGMLGEAVVRNAGGMYVDVMTLFQDACDRVPRLAASINGIQTPMIGFPKEARSFDIGLITEQLDFNLSEKPVFTSPRFQDDDFGDAAGLESALENLFLLETERGQQASLIYVSASDFPNAYSVRGRYETVDGKIQVNARIFKPDGTKVDLDLSPAESGEQAAQLILRAIKRTMR